MKARDLRCSVCGSEVDVPCDLSVEGPTVGSYHQARIRLARDTEMANNKAKKELAQSRTGKLS